MPSARCITIGAGPSGFAFGVGLCRIVCAEEAAIAADAFAFRRSTRSTAYGAAVAAEGCAVLMHYAYRTPPEIARPPIRMVGLLTTPSKLGSVRKAKQSARHAGNTPPIGRADPRILGGPDDGGHSIACDPVASVWGRTACRSSPKRKYSRNRKIRKKLCTAARARGDAVEQRSIHAVPNP